MIGFKKNITMMNFSEVILQSYHPTNPNQDNRMIGLERKSIMRIGYREILKSCNPINSNSDKI